MTILHGVLDLQTKSVRDLIDSQHNAFDRLHMISFDERMDYNMMDLLMCAAAGQTTSRGPSVTTTTAPHLPAWCLLGPRAPRG